MSAAPAQASFIAPFDHKVMTKQHSRTSRDRVKERKEHRAKVIERNKFNRKTRYHGYADTSTFQKALPGWYTPHLEQYRSMVLSAPALKAYYKACEMVGHYIGGAGYRSHSTQANMTSSLAAPPGYSYHEVGLAADIFGVNAEEHRALLAVGFQQLNGEPWHYSYRVYG